MADPSRLDIFGWVEAGVLALLGALFPYIFSKLKSRRDEVDAKLNTHSDLIGRHVAQLAVLENEKENVTQQLNEIKEGTSTLHAKIDSLIITLMHK